MALGEGIDQTSLTLVGLSGSKAVPSSSIVGAGRGSPSVLTSISLGSVNPCSVIPVFKYYSTNLFTLDTRLCYCTVIVIHVFDKFPAAVKAKGKSKSIIFNSENNDDNNNDNEKNKYYQECQQ